MARRRSLNRRWSRRSANGTGILNDDSNISDDDDPLWWNRLENKTNSIRPSGQFSLGESATTSELNPNTTINDSETSGDWWEVLQKTSQDLVPKKRDKSNSSITSKRENIISNTSDSETDDRLRQTKKRKINFRRTRRSLGKNAFSQALDSSEPAIESEPAFLQNSHVIRTSFQSLDELPLRTTRQRSKNDSTLSHNSNSSDTERIHKTRPTLFRKPRRTVPHTAFEDVLEGDESVIGPSQSVNAEKSNDDSDVSSRRSSTRSRALKIKQILGKTPPSNNKSLSDSTKNVSLTNETNNKTSRTVLSSAASTVRKQNQKTKSDDESEELISQSRSYVRKNRRKKVSTNPFHNIVSDSDCASGSNKSSKTVGSNSLQLHISPANSEATSNNISKTREIEQIDQSVSSQLRQSKRYESDKASTTSISEELKTGKSSQQTTTIADNSSPVSDKMNTSLNSSISNVILQDWNSDDSDRPVRATEQKTNATEANISEYNTTTESNDENREPKTSTKKSQLQGEHNAANDLKRKSSLTSHSNTLAKKNVSNTSIERKENSNEQNQVHPSRKSIERALIDSSSENSTEESEIQSFQRKRRSGKTAIVESEASDEIINKKPMEKLSRSEKFPVEESDINDEENMIDLPLQKSSQGMAVSDGKIISRKSDEKPSQSTKISDRESKTSDEEIFNSKSILHQSHSLERAEEDLEENNNEGLSVDSPEKSPIAQKIRKSLRRTREIPTRLSKSHSKVQEINAEPADDSDSDSEISRDPSAYELPDMNRSDSVTLSDSDNENEVPNNKNTSKNRSPQKNHSPVKHGGAVKDRSLIKNKNNISQFFSKDTVAQPSEPLPSTSGIQKETPVRKSLINPSKSRSSKVNVSSNQRSMLNFLTTCSSRAMPREPLPTQEDVRDFQEKFKAVIGTKDLRKELHKEEMEKELDQVRISLAKQTNLNKKKGEKKIILRKKPDNPTKGVDKAFIVNGKVYKQPKLPRPKHWATDRLYKYLWKIMEPKYKLETRIRSEKFMLDLSNIVTIVMRRKKYDNYKDEVDTLMKNMARLGIINTRSDFYHFCYDFLPYEFRVKVTPILLPGKKRSIPFDPDTVNVPILNK